MGDSYRDAIRKERQKSGDTSISRAIARAAAAARAKVRAQHSRVARNADRTSVEKVTEQLRLFDAESY